MWRDKSCPSWISWRPSRRTIKFIRRANREERSSSVISLKLTKVLKRITQKQLNYSLSSAGNTSLRSMSLTSSGTRRESISSYSRNFALNSILTMLSCKDNECVVDGHLHPCCLLVIKWDVNADRVCEMVWECDRIFECSSGICKIITSTFAIDRSNFRPTTMDPANCDSDGGGFGVSPAGDKKGRRTRTDPNNRNFICGCGKSYLSYPALYTHIKQKHNGIVRGHVQPFMSTYSFFLWLATSRHEEAS